jgi:hypothetical protein
VVRRGEKIRSRVGPSPIFLLVASRIRLTLRTSVPKRVAAECVYQILSRARSRPRCCFDRSEFLSIFRVLSCCVLKKKMRAWDALNETQQRSTIT